MPARKPISPLPRVSEYFNKVNSFQKLVKCDSCEEMMERGYVHVNYPWVKRSIITGHISIRPGEDGPIIRNICDPCFQKLAEERNRNGHNRSA